MAMAANPAMPDFWRYYGNKKLSDLTIVLIQEDAAAPTITTTSGSSKRKREDGEQLCGHGVVLAAFSGYCRTKLEEWDGEPADDAGSSRAPKRQILMPVPAGQLDIGRLLIRGIYQQQPDLSGVSQVQLMQLLLLADRFEVPKVAGAVSAAFKALPLEQLQWETVMAVYGLPAGCAELAACRDLFSAAMAKLQRELGDLESALADPESSKAQQLLGLPFGALQSLLQDERTRVASENTVFYAIQQWHKHQEQQAAARAISQVLQQPQRRHLRKLLAEQAKELLQLVRMPQCSQLFIATVVGQDKLANRCFSPADLLIANTFSSSSTHGRLPTEATGLPAFQRHPAWLLPARPKSSLRQLPMVWKPPLAELRMAFEEQLQRQEVVMVTGSSKVWQGLHVAPRMWLERSSGSEAAATYSFRFGCSFPLRPGEARRAAFVVKAHNFHRQMPAGILCSKPSLFSSQECLGGSLVVELGPVSSWDAAEAAVRQSGLVGPDGCLQLLLQVYQVDRAAPSPGFKGDDGSSDDDNSEDASDEDSDSSDDDDDWDDDDDDDDDDEDDEDEEGHDDW